MSFSVAPEVGAQLAPDRLVRVVGRAEGGRRIVERADILSGPFDIRPERRLQIQPPRTRDSGDRRGGRSGPDADDDRRGRGGRSGPDRVDRPERPDRSGPGGGGRPERPERPERIDRSGSNSGRG
jgi:hypothetical protein